MEHWDILGQFGREEGKEGRKEGRRGVAEKKGRKKEAPQDFVGKEYNRRRQR